MSISSQAAERDAFFSATSNPRYDDETGSCPACEHWSWAKNGRTISRKCWELKMIHPGRLTWNLQITPLEGKMIFQTSMIMVHVNLPGCRYKVWKKLCFFFAAAEDRKIYISDTFVARAHTQFDEFWVVFIPIRYGLANNARHFCPISMTRSSTAFGRNRTMIRENPQF